MLLSVVVYNHKLTAGQWVGAGIVFAGISVEALVKRTGDEVSATLAHGRLTYPLQRSTRNVLHRRRRRQRSRNYKLLGLGLFTESFSHIDFVVIPIFIHSPISIIIRAAPGPHETCMQATGDTR